MASYFVTGVWKDANKVITEIFFTPSIATDRLAKDKKLLLQMAFA